MQISRSSQSVVGFTVLKLLTSGYGKMGINRQYTHRVVPQSVAGFSLLEVLIVMIAIGVLTAIAAPSLLGFVDRQRLNTANNQIYLAMGKAQSNAKKEKVIWQASFREQNEVVEWTIHRQSVTPSSGSWDSLQANVRIDESNTTLGQDTSINAWIVRFDHKGNYDDSDNAVPSPPVRITLYNENTGQIKRCVSVSSLLGALRTDSDEGCS
ncbi:MAG: Tfp pilus assembly protein FimT/FimU [Xenococcaceae cyanobacterium]